MCLKGLEGILYISNDGLPCLVLDEKTTLEHIDGILGLCENVYILSNHAGGLIVGSPPNIDIETIALDIGEGGARIKIDPNIYPTLAKGGFLQPYPLYEH